MSGTLGNAIQRTTRSTTVILISLLATGLVAWKLMAAVILSDPPRLRSDLPPLIQPNGAGLSLVIASAQDSADAASAAATLRNAEGPPLHVLTLHSSSGRNTRRLLRSLGHSAPVLLTLDAERRIVQIQPLTIP